MKLSRRRARIRRHRRIRTIISGTADRPRICLSRTNRHIAAQLVDDEAGRTLASVSSLSKESREGQGAKNFNNRATAQKLGVVLGQKMKTLGIHRAVFDRGGALYHGVVKEFADGVRSVDEEHHFHF